MQGIVDSIASLWAGLSTFFSGFLTLFTKLGYALVVLLSTPLVFVGMFIKICIQYLNLLIAILPNFLTTYVFSIFVVRVLKFIWNRSQGSHHTGTITRTTTTTRPVPEKKSLDSYHISEGERYK